MLEQQFNAVGLGYSCLAGWNYYNSSCYYVSTVAKKQSDARSDCQDLGGDLVSVEDDDEMNFITSISCVLRRFLANVNSRSRSLFAVARQSVVCMSSVCLSSVCNARAPYSGGSNFRQYFYGIRYLGHPLTSTENFTEIVPGEPLRRGS